MPSIATTDHIPSMAASVMLGTAVIEPSTSTMVSSVEKI